MRGGKPGRRSRVPARLTTLCYIVQDHSVLMLQRNRKKNDPNEGKWIGIGGKVEPGESPDECLLREVFEETGLTLQRFDCKGIITFVSDEWDDEYMVLYSADRFTGVLKEDCPEGQLCWIPIEEVMRLPMWEGDRYFLQPLLEGKEKIQMKLVYKGDQLVSAVRHTGRETQDVVFL